MVHKSRRDKLVLGLPKGSLQDSTVDLFERAGYTIRISSRSYYPSIDDEDISAIILRPQEMSRFVEAGTIDLGLTGYDWVRENDSDVVEVAELVYAKQRLAPVRWVLAVPESSEASAPEDLSGGMVSTELVNVTRKYFAERGVDVEVEFSHGATEVKANLGELYDAIVDVTETGSSLRANRLRVVDTVLTSSTRLIANREAMDVDWKRRKIENIAMLLTAAIEAREKVGLKLNVPRAKLEEITKILPAEKSPTVSDLAASDWVAVEVIVEEVVERELIPQLRRAGATGIITYPLNKIIP
ncbi:MAG: ATP phosphoribosyltransferase [Planctomycetota bacterium]